MNQTTFNSLQQRNILLGVTGGIACYKAAELVRRLKTQGANVRVVMTKGALAFVKPMTFQALSGNPVHLELLDEAAEAGMGHIELARWADLILVAPATANFIERAAQGRGDDLLSTLCLATTAPILIAPSMNQAMWTDEATTNNMATLQSRGFGICGPGIGEQACGDIGAGRMLEPMELVAKTNAALVNGPLQKKTVVITAGPTREGIDPVRYLSNYSSGKMGFALAEAAVKAGARVILIAGPVALECHPHVKRIDVSSAEDMFNVVKAQCAKLNADDIFISCAAVADYRPKKMQPQKIKKTADSMTLEMIKNPDILQWVAAQDTRPICIGFAAESTQVEAYAKEKLQRKKLDVIVANDISRQDIGFGADNNEAFFISKTETTLLKKAPKAELAKQIILFTSNI